jgi:hypothetical protein
MATRTLEDRLTIVEQELARLKQRLDADNAPPSSAGWEQIFGIFADDPLFEEAVRLGREWRDAQNALSEEEPDAPA